MTDRTPHAEPEAEDAEPERPELAEPEAEDAEPEPVAEPPAERQAENWARPDRDPRDTGVSGE